MIKTLKQKKEFFFSSFPKELMELLKYNQKIVIMIID